MAERSSSWWRRQMRITWHLPAVLCGLALAFGIWSRWDWLTSTPPRVLELSGTHHQIGIEHGQALRQEIGRLYNDYVIGGLVEREGWPLNTLVDIGHHYEPFIPQPYVEEMKGIAQGAGVPYEHILVMNTFADAVLGASPRACSAFAVRTTKGLVVGRNLDWTNHGVAHRHGMVFLLELPNGRRLLNIGWPGMVGTVTGMNDHGLVLALNMAFATDLETNATPMLFRLREALETESTISGATHVMVSQSRTFAANVLIVGADEDRAVVLELSGRRHAVVEMKSGLAITTNYYQALDIKGGVGGERQAILWRRLMGTGADTTPEDARHALSDVCFRGSSLGMVTNQSAVFLPRSRLVQVALGALPATSGRYYDIQLQR